MIFFLCATLLVTVPDATQSRPERLLAPAEVLLDVGPSAFVSALTKTPAGAHVQDDYFEFGLRVRAEVGILRFFKVSLNVPLAEVLSWQQQGQGLVRFGDPTLGFGAGVPFARAHLAAFSELGFAVSKRLELRPADPSLQLANRGVVATTGGISALFGAFVFSETGGDNWTLRFSARAAYRVRNADASSGITGDLRLEFVTARHLLLGFDCRLLVPFFGLERSLISPARTADSAGWIDAGIRAGVRFSPAIDLSAYCQAPLYTFAGGLGVSVGLVASFRVGERS